jgi:hypothetical protein
MKWLLLLALLVAGPLRSEPAPAPSVREKLRARIVETLPPPPSGWPAEAKPASDEPVLVLEPMVVTESKGVRELAKVLADDQQRQEAERFSVVKGGKIYSSERLDVGGWWSPTGGWTFLKIKW